MVTGKSRENFVRLAESRTNKVLKDLDLLSNLSNRSNYSYSDKDVRKIFSAINKKIKEAQSKFELNLKANKRDGFKL